MCLVKKSILQRTELASQRACIGIKEAALILKQLPYCYY